MTDNSPGRLHTRPHIHIRTLLLACNSPTHPPALLQVTADLKRGAMRLGHERAASWLYRAARKQTKLTVSAPDSHCVSTFNAHLNLDLLARASPTRLVAGAAAGRSGDGAASFLSCFEDGDRPIVIDLGCGYGVGALTAGAETETLVTSSACANYLGCDLSPQGAGFACGVAARWGLKGRVAFVRRDALAVLRLVGQHYRGHVAAVVLCCPSPYRAAMPTATQSFSERGGRPTPLGIDVELFPLGIDAESPDARGNSQLPSSADSEMFLGRSAVLQEAVHVLAPGGWLLLSSNAEDVAVAMASAACELGLEIAELDTEPATWLTQLNRQTGGSDYSQGDRLDHAGLGSPEAGSGAPHARGNLLEASSADGSWHGELPLQSVTSPAFEGGALSRRSVRWREHGGMRAEGLGWRRSGGWKVTGQGAWGDVVMAVSRPAWSETELAHRVDGAAVHRMLLRKPA
jgi:SAM-dependent methyltransferase